MNARMVTCAILLALTGAGTVVHGQELAPQRGVQPPPLPRDQTAAPETIPASGVVPPPGTPPGPGFPIPGSPGIPGGAGPVGLSPEGPPVPPGTSGLSEWIRYARPGSGCCEPGPLKPMYTEAYLRVGPAVPVGGNYLGRELLVGWALEGGFRALFFNRPNSAWVIDLGIVNTNNGALSPGTPKTLDLILPNAVLGRPTEMKIPVTMRNFNITMASLGIGKEYYIFPPAEPGSGRWRIGWDGGGRYGSSSMTFNEIRHRTRTCEGIYLAGNLDYEIPCGCCYMAFGLRAEWSYTWDTILQGQTNLQLISGLATFTVRY